MSEPKVSVCIPAYKDPDGIRKAIRSVLDQTFRDFELVVTDDSPDACVEKAVREFSSDARVRYFRNPDALGSPENWNEAVRRSRGEYIKFLHHDDWFLSETSLASFVALLDDAPAAGFAFAGSGDYGLAGKPLCLHAAGPAQIKKIKRSPASLFAGNKIGSPSATIYRRSIGIEFDPQLKWLVDLDFYIRCLLKNREFAHTEEILVGITTGSPTQISAECFGDREVEVFEHVYVYRKLSADDRTDRDVFRRLWFVLKTYGIVNEQDLLSCGVNTPAGTDLNRLFFWLRADRKMRRAIAVFSLTFVWEYLLRMAAYAAVRRRATTHP